MTYWKAAEAGVDIIDCATTPFALGTSQPSTDVMVEAFRGTAYDTGLDQNLLKKISDYFTVEAFRGTAYDTGLDQNLLKKISDYFTPYREECIKNGLLSTKVLGVNTRTMLYQVPGGMLSNMIKQLADQGKSDKLTEVLEEVPRVRKDLGEPPLVTPSSQIVGTQARQVRPDNQADERRSCREGYRQGEYVETYYVPARGSDRACDGEVHKGGKGARRGERRGCSVLRFLPAGCH